MEVISLPPSARGSQKRCGNLAQASGAPSNSGMVASNSYLMLGRDDFGLVDRVILRRNLPVSVNYMLTVGSRACGSNDTDVIHISIDRALAGCQHFKQHVHTVSTRQFGGFAAATFWPKIAGQTSLGLLQTSQGTHALDVAVTGEQGRGTRHRRARQRLHDRAD